MSSRSTRRDCLEITGIPVVPYDSPALLVKEMSEIMGVNLNENDISIAHRLPPTKKVKDRLIVKFTRREKRDEIHSKRKNLKSKRTKDLPSVVCEPESAVESHKAQIHVNESTENDYWAECYNSSPTTTTSLFGWLTVK